MFVKKQLKVFNFKSEILSALAFLYPVKSVSMPTSVFDLIEKILIEFDKALTTLEHHAFVYDDEFCHTENCDAASFWLKVHNLKSPMDL